MYSFTAYLVERNAPLSSIVKCPNASCSNTGLFAAFNYINE